MAGATERTPGDRQDLREARNAQKGSRWHQQSLGSSPLHPRLIVAPSSLQQKPRCRAAPAGPLPSSPGSAPARSWVLALSKSEGALEPHSPPVHSGAPVSPSAHLPVSRSHPSCTPHCLALPHADTTILTALRHPGQGAPVTRG